MQVARRPSGDIVVYPVVETVQRDGMCREVIAPAPIAPHLASAAEQFARDLAAAVDLAGFLAIELFVVDGRLVVNELAPVYTTAATTPSRVASPRSSRISYGPCSTGPSVHRSCVRHAVMVNVVGSEAGDPTDRLAAALLVDDVHVHLYGKSWRPGRKLGHVTALADDVDVARQRAHAAVRALGGLAMDA